ncbi:hypothetical protein AB0D97_27035, partial [Streptomyces roseus]|uniref:hypothetical protein n=1 Tax=Streptomyces roseus TaxID=66430 RepID=UPI00340B37CC
PRAQLRFRADQAAEFGRQGGRGPLRFPAQVRPLIIRGQLAEEAVEDAVIAGHEKYAGDFEIRIGPAQDETAGKPRDGRDGKDPGTPPPAP